MKKDFDFDLGDVEINLTIQVPIGCGLGTSAASAIGCSICINEFFMNDEMLKEYSGHDYTTTEGLTRIFNDVQGVAYALNYALIAGGHGTGWTGVNDWQDYPNRMPRRASKVFPAKAATMNDLPYPRTRFYGSVTSKDFSIDITQLSEAIRQAGMHMQYILFDDCYMANVEVAYELRDVTNFLLASTSEVFDEGMPYAKMWTYLATPTPNYSSAVSAFKSYLDNYKAPEGSSPFSVDPTGTLAAIDCRQMDNLAAVMRQVNEHYTLDEARTLLAEYKDRFNAQLPNTRGTHPDPQAPINPISGTGRRYSQFPAFLRAILHNQLKST